MIKLMGKRLEQPNWLQLTVVFLLMLGIFFRFFNLDRKVYWIDEIYSSLRLSGYRETELVQQVFTGEIISVADLQKYQRPNSEKSLGGTLQSLAIESPQHPPLYYAIARSWVQIWGYSVTAIRSLSALISLLLFPAIYWLCLELFDSPAIGGIAIALIAISPFHVLYAQEAREYSLWMVAIAASSAALLKAMRLSKSGETSWKNWAIYGGSLALGLYTFLFHWFVAIAQVIYVVVTEKFGWTERLKSFLFAAGAGIILYLPWLVVTIANLPRIHTSSSWTTEQVRSSSLLRRWLIDGSRLFFDLNINAKTFTIPTIFVLLVIVYAIYFFCRQAPKQTQLFIWSLIGVQGLALALPDLIVGGLRSANSRYLIPCYIGLDLIVAYCLVTHIGMGRKRSSYKLWRMNAIALILCGIVSCIFSSQSVLWWSKSPVKHKGNQPIAEIVNYAKKPLLISDDSTVVNDCFACRIVALSYNLDPKVKLQLVTAPNIPKIPDKFSDVFLFSPEEKLRKAIETQQNYNSILLFQDDNFWLWKLRKNPIAKVAPAKSISNLSHQSPE